MTFKLTSPAFTEGQPIPSRYSCEGENISHALEWGDAPAGTKSFALINDDPDDDGPDPWVHWLIYNIPGASRGLPENIPVQETLSDGTLQGKNSFRKIGYGGPCPPSGTHHYYFKLYALDQVLPLPARATRAELDSAMSDHILGHAQLMGTYRKRA
jgi:Raf kinase inhibitor-like YbhB/YbcL family protein